MMIMTIANDGSVGIAERHQSLLILVPQGETQAPEALLEREATDRVQLRMRAERLAEPVAKAEQRREPQSHERNHDDDELGELRPRPDSR